MSASSTYQIVEPQLTEAIQSSYDILQEFSKEIRFPFRPDLDSIDRMLRNHKHYCRLVKLGNLCCGGILCLKLTHPFNDSVSMSCECYYWIHPDHRGGTHGLRLIRGYSNWCERESINISCLVSTESSPSGIDKVYNKLGFNLNERTFTRWSI